MWYNENRTTILVMAKQKKIKNYFVRNEPIQNSSRGLVGYVNYLQDKEHRNHKKRTSEIIHIHGNVDNFLDTVVGEADALQLQRDKAKKGGRPISSFAQSYVFGMPERFVGKPTKKQYQEMAKDMLKVIADKLGVKPADLLDHTFINVHVNKNNPHINIVVGRTIDGQNYEKILTRPSTSNALKRESSRTVKRVLGLDINRYEPLIPPGTTRGARWDELNKMNNFKIEEKKDFFKKVALINQKLQGLIDQVSNKADQTAVDFVNEENELKAEIKSIKSKHKETIEEIKSNKNVEVEYSESYELMQSTEKNVQKYNDIKKKGRKIRSLGLSM